MLSLAFTGMMSYLSLVRARASKMTNEVTLKIEFIPKRLDMGFQTFVCTRIITVKNASAKRNCSQMRKSHAVQDSVHIFPIPSIQLLRFLKVCTFL